MSTTEEQLKFQQFHASLGRQPQGPLARIATFVVGTILMVKLSENEKYDPIIQQQNEEMARMNIRVVK